MYKEGASIDCSNSVAPPREPIAAEICKFAAGLAERAENLAARVGGKLSTVATSPAPQCREDSKLDSREYPPLFAELRNRFFTLSSAMDQIEDTLSRTEL